MPALQDTYTLANGVEIPQLGLGTWLIDDDEVVDAVVAAVDIGYRHIDTAQAYGNERGVGEGIRKAGIDRDELFVTTKLDAGIKSHDDAVMAIDASLATLGLDHIDLMIIHSPQPWQEFGGDDRHVEGNRAAWRALEEAHEAGKLRAIGLSNFRAADIDSLLEASSIDPMVNQILAHVGNTPTGLIEHSRDNGMLVEGYSPFAHGKLFGHRQVADIADRYDVSVARLAVRYLLQLGLLPLPKTADPDHMRSNADVDFRITEDDMRTLQAIGPIDYGDATRFPVYAEAQ